MGIIPKPPFAVKGLRNGEAENGEAESLPLQNSERLRGPLNSGETLIEEGAATLNKLAGLMQAKGMAEPRFKMVLTAKGAFAYTRPDGVIVCPLSALRPSEV